MLVTNRKTPPVILRLINTPFSALESLISIGTNPGLISQKNPPEQVEEDMDKFLLSQFIMYLYINIFVFKDTSIVYKNMIDDGLIYLRNQQSLIKDTYLRELISEFIDFEDTKKLNTPAMVSLLDSAIKRLRPAQAYSGLAGIIPIVLSIYGKSSTHSDDTVLHSISIQNIDGFDKPVFVITPLLSISMDTKTFETISSLFWKLLFSLNIDSVVKKPGDLTDILYLLAYLALPLDPSSLTDQMKNSMIDQSKTGIPFLNYLAMYLREKDMGINYTLSPFADSRRILMRRSHQFFGVGGTSIQDYAYTKMFLSHLCGYELSNGLTTSNKMSDSDIQIIGDLLKGRPDSAIKFVSSVSYEEALEAAKIPVVKNPDPKIDDPITKDPGVKKPIKKKKIKPTIPTNDDSFADDPSPDEDTSDQDPKVPQDTEETSDDNIDQTSDVGQDSAVVNKKVFFPLALPTETIDDHLLRIMVLKYVADMDKDPAPDITPENLEGLKYWCNTWLFIASIDQTKKLLAQLNLTSQLKELKI